MTVLVLLPGMDGSGLFFSDLVDELGPKCQVISYPSNEALGYKELINFVRSRLPKHESFILLGESFSGPIAISLAAEQPPNLKALVLVCSFAKSPLPPLLAITWPVVFLIPFWRLPSGFAARALLGRFYSKALREQFSKATRHISPNAWKARIKSVLAVDVTRVLRRVEVPTLYLRASEDKLVSSSCAGVISSCKPDTRIVEIEGPHFLLQTKPGQAAVALRAFANECGFAL